MSFNPEINEISGEPIRMKDKGELFILLVNNVDFEITIEKDNNRKEKGTNCKLLLSTMRVVIINHNGGPEDIKGFDMPLAFTYNDKFE